ncbi:MAG: hypothetical protein AAGA31_08550 [Bacteroidota bacterium]
MADNAQLSPKTIARRRKYAKGKDRRSCDGNLKISYRYHQHRLPRPMSFFASSRHKGDFDLEFAQLQKVIDNRKGQIAWAAIYDCTHSRFGPEIAQYTDEGGWKYHTR